MFISCYSITIKDLYSSLIPSDLKVLMYGCMQALLAYSTEKSPISSSWVPLPYN